jgi:hypothetical protein
MINIEEKIPVLDVLTFCLPVVSDSVQFVSLSGVACFSPLKVPLLSEAFGRGHTDSGVGIAGLCQDPSVVSTLIRGTHYH